MNETEDSVANLFTKRSHHRNISVVFLVQNLFHKNKQIRTISLNVHYLVLFKNPRDATQFASLARQMYPNKSAFAVEAYKDATAHKHFFRRDRILLRTEMSTRVKTYLPTLKRIRRLGEKARRDYVRKCDNKFIHCVSKCAKTVIKGNVPHTTRQMKNLRCRRNDLRALSAKKTSLRKKNKKFCRKMAF